MGISRVPNCTGHQRRVIQVQVHSHTLEYMVQPKRGREEKQVSERANCRKNLGRVRETSGIQVDVGKRARVPESKYKYFILK